MTSNPFSPLTVADYAQQAQTTDKQSDGGSLAFPMLGLFGETGSLLSEVKKKQRDQKSYKGYASAVVEELGDVLWYLTVVASRVNIPLNEIATYIASDCSGWHKMTGSALTFASLQPDIISRQFEPTPVFEQTLMSLAGEVGMLLVEHQLGQLANNQATFTRLAAILRLLRQAANEAGVTLEAAAVKNLAKIFDRWPRDRVYPDFLDTSAVEDEQLPRTLTVDIFERTVNGNDYVYQRCNGINIGDRLTDNAVIKDDYRFHDVFHLSYVAVLGWSPVIRSLLRLKRKEDPKVDEVQDGARAALIEEGVTTWIFGQASNLDLFEGMSVNDLPFGLLKRVREFVIGYEVENTPLWVWEEAILQGYVAFRFLRKHRRGRVHIDMNNHYLSIKSLP